VVCFSIGVSITVGCRQRLKMTIGCREYKEAAITFKSALRMAAITFNMLIIITATVIVGVNDCISAPWD
jgi:hypothetical protein